MQVTPCYLKRSLLNCAPCAPVPPRLTYYWYASYVPACLHAHALSLSLIRALRIYAPLTSSISALRLFFLCCVVIFQLKGKVPMFCVCFSINHSSPVSLSSLLFYHIKLLYMFFFLLFTLSHWLHHYLHNYFATTFSNFLFCFPFKINELNKYSIFTHVTHGQIL